MASFNVADFRAQLTGDGARPNLFECVIPNLNQFVTSAPEKFNFMCRAAQLPGATIGSIPVNYFGRELKFAGNRTFTEWTVTVINDEDFIVRNAMEKWMHEINTHETNRRLNTRVSPLQYQLDGYVLQHGKAGLTQPIKRYDFVGLFPIDISPIEVDWGANDTIEEFAVTFSYQWWTSDTAPPVSGNRTVAQGQSRGAGGPF